MTFQLTASQGGWQFMKTIHRTGYVFQLTASQGGWPTMWCQTRRLVWISTHSLTRRLTGIDQLLVLICDISTHSLTRRLTEKFSELKTIAVFQLTASQGGWHRKFPLFTKNRIFQLTASQGGWRTLWLALTLISIFQLTASQGGWRRRRTESGRGGCISTHSLTRRLTFSNGIRPRMIRYFNSQPHKEADADELGFEENTVISTHSLTRRLTLSAVQHSDRRDISTHSLTRRLTKPHWISRLMHFHFNSQPHKEADKKAGMTISSGLISTHSLTRRLTSLLITLS